MRHRAIAVACGILLMLNGGVARSDTEECRNAREHIKAAQRGVSSALRHYGQCVTDSKGRDDCVTEFSTLHSAQDDFEAAVSEKQSNCSD